MTLRSLAIITLGLAPLSCTQDSVQTLPSPKTTEAMNTDPAPDTAPQTATFGAGCFWCVEAVLEQVDGVLDVESGYMGGSIANPTYEQVCSGTTGHAEVVQVKFDPATISYRELLVWFFKLHDPTTLNRQGADRGTQYRSAIFYHSQEQKLSAEGALDTLEEAKAYATPVVTEVTAAGPYYVAETYHQDYYRLNKQADYCQVVIAPKLEKLLLDK